MTDQEKRCKHLTEEDREEIQAGLNVGMTFKQIARRIQKDQTTVSKEVKKHIEKQPARSEKGLAEPVCEKKLKPPFVCNGCKKSSRCQQERQFYVARKAHAAYRETLVACREGIVLNKEVFYAEDQILTEAVRNGQHLYHAVQSTGVSMSLTSAYRYAKKGYMSFSVLDLPRAVKFKPRRVDKEPRLPAKTRQEHSYEKFLEFCEAEDVSSWVEMDTVIGRPGGKIMMTFIFTCCNFMFAILLNDKTAASASTAVQGLKDRLGRSGFSFGEIMPVILTDNGREFNHIAAFENDLEGNPESHLFFCEAYHSSEKPRVEKNHTLLRDILPQGTSFDELTQDDVNLVLSHVNGVIRKGLHGKSAFQVFTSLFSERLANILGISFVAPCDVIQSPALLKK